jgi:hypothetical protein
MPLGLRLRSHSVESWVVVGWLFSRVWIGCLWMSREYVRCMGTRQSNRSQQGARAEARRRIAERARQAESALTIYLRLGEQIVAARALIESYEMQQCEALAALASVLGRDQAAAAAGVEVRDLKAALAQASEYETGSDQALARKAPVATS